MEQLSLKTEGVSDDPATLLIPKPEVKIPINLRANPRAQTIPLETEEIEFVETEIMNREAPQKGRFSAVAKGKSPLKLGILVDNKKEKDKEKEKESIISVLMHVILIRNSLSNLPTYNQRLKQSCHWLIRRKCSGS